MQLAIITSDGVHLHHTSTWPPPTITDNFPHLNSSLLLSPTHWAPVPSPSDSESESQNTMERFRIQRRVQIEDSKSDPPKYDDVPEDDNDNDNDEPEGTLRFRASNSNVSDNQEPFMGIKVRRNASLHRDCKGDYLDVPSHPFLMKILHKQGDKQVLFADKVLKFTGSGKMKRCVLLITGFAIYIVDPEVDAVKRRIALAAVEKICLSELNDNFFAVIIPTEYDLLMASTRKTEIVTVLVEATKSASDFELKVVFSNRFEYNAASDLVKEVQFEEVEGGVRTRILRK